MRFKCPKCKNRNFWNISDNRLKCKRCKYLFTPKENSANILNKILKQLISEFLLKHSTNTILDRVNISKYKLLKLLTLFRMEMTKDIPEAFEGIVEVDETYLSGQWKNKRLSAKKQQEQSKKDRGTTKQPIFGILCRNGTV
jgi:ribosomal protein S27E